MNTETKMPRSKKGIFLSIISAAVVVIIGFMIFRKPSSEKSTPQEATGTPFTPDSIEEVNEKVAEKQFGVPVKTHQEGNDTVLEYNSLSETRNHILIEDTNKDPLFFKVIHTNDSQLRIADLKSEFGEPNHVLFGPDADAGVNLYVYPLRGLAYLGHSFTGLVLEVWYFEPTNLESFLNTWGSSYSTERQPEQGPPAPPPGF